MRRLLGLEGQGSPTTPAGFVMLHAPSPKQGEASRPDDGEEHKPLAGALSPLSMHPPVKVPYSE